MYRQTHHKLLGLSTPRSGTRFLTHVLRNCGIKVGHEMFKRDGTIGCFFAVEDCWYPGKHWNSDDESLQHRSDYTFDQVWHFVRDPRFTIPSLAAHTFPGSMWCWLERHTGISAGTYPRSLAAIRFWPLWHELIEKNQKPDFFFRIEEIDLHWPEIKERLGLDPGLEMPNVPRDHGTSERGPRAPVLMSWDEMKSLDAEAGERVRDLAARYGYE